MVDSYGTRLLPLSGILISQIRNKLSEKIIDIINIGKHFLHQASITPVNHRSKLNHTAKSFLENKKSIVERATNSLNNNLITYTDRKKSKLSALENTLKILKPENVLLRGYTITSLDGKILKRSDRVKEDDILETRFIDGKIKSVVRRKKDK
jgi:exodeoxyribonuclease VII large subunit